MCVYIKFTCQNYFTITFDMINKCWIFSHLSFIKKILNRNPMKTYKSLHIGENTAYQM